MWSPTLYFYVSTRKAALIYKNVAPKNYKWVATKLPDSATVSLIDYAGMFGFSSPYPTLHIAEANETRIRLICSAFRFYSSTLGPTQWG